MKYYLYFISKPNKLTKNIYKEILQYIKNHELKILQEEILAESECYCFLLDFNSDENIFLNQVREDFYKLEIDIFLVKEKYRKIKKLLIADMDSTIIENECIDEIAKYANKYEEVKKVTEAAMNGELDFSSSLIKRVKLLESIPLTSLEEIYNNNIKLSYGAEILGKTLKKYNCHLALASGGFQFFTNKIKEKISFNEDHSNNLEVKNNILTGNIIPPIFDNNSKLKLSKKLQEKLNLQPEEIICVGDGANDIPMLKSTPFGIAYKAKETVKTVSQHHINHSSLTSILYLQGIKKIDFII